MRPKLSYYSYDSLENPWVSGGGALRDFEVLRRFAKQAEVTLYTGCYPGFKEENRDGVHIKGLGFGNSNGLCRLSFSLAANFRMLFDNADAIGISPSIYAPILAFLFRNRRSYLVMHHSVGSQSFRKFGLLGLMPFLYEIILLKSGCNYFISNRALANRIKRRNPSAKVQLTSNGFDPALLELQTKPSDPPFILFLGRFDIYMKGLDNLIKAYTEAAALKNVDLVLAGRSTPENLEKIRTLIPESARSHVRLETDISEARKSELLSSCLFFCSPSRFEGFGIAALEANAAGKAALVTDTDGFRDSLALGETALAVPPDDIHALTAGMFRLIEDGSLRDDMGRKGRERAKAFGWDAIADREWNWVENILKGSA